MPQGLPPPPPGAARFVVISGCSGGGKSTLLEALRARGHAVVEEPGRRIVAEQLASGGKDLPWLDLEAFARRAVAMAMADRQAAAARAGWVFFDRGLVDAASALASVTDAEALRMPAQHRYNDNVFLTPPWPALFAADNERRHDLRSALAEFERLADVYPRLGYRVHLLPRVGVAERADFLLARLG